MTHKIQAESCKTTNIREHSNVPKIQIPTSLSTTNTPKPHERLFSPFQWIEILQMPSPNPPELSSPTQAGRLEWEAPHSQALPSQLKFRLQSLLRTPASPRVQSRCPRSFGFHPPWLARTESLGRALSVLVCATRVCTAMLQMCGCQAFGRKRWTLGKLPRAALFRLRQPRFDCSSRSSAIQAQE